MVISAPAEEADLRCKRCPVRHHSICRALDESHRHELSDIMIHRHFAVGQEIIHQGDASKLFAIIVSGVVKLIRVLPDGRQQIVGLLSGAACLGDVFSAVSHDSVECVTDVELCCFQRPQIESVFKTHPELEHRLFQSVAKDLEDAREWMLTLGRRTAREKVATFLLWLGKDEQNHCPDAPKPQDDPILDIPFARHEIADFLGLTLETVSRIFSRLNATGVIKLSGAKSVEIRDINVLRQLAEPDG